MLPVAARGKGCLTLLARALLPSN